MPKVTLGTQGLDDAARNILGHVLVDTPRQKLAKLLGIGEKCLSERKKKPEMMRLRELRILRRTGRITDEQVLAMVREEGK